MLQRSDPVRLIEDQANRAGRSARARRWWPASIRCTVRRLMATFSARTTCQALLAKCRLSDRLSRLGRLGGDRDHQRPHPIGELGRTSGPGTRPGARTPPPPGAAATSNPRRGLAQALCRLRAAKAGLLVQQEGRPGQFYLEVRDSLRGLSCRLLAIAEGPDLEFGRSPLLR